jgi:hypothetical protein
MGKHSYNYDNEGNRVYSFEDLFLIRHLTGKISE